MKDQNKGKKKLLSSVLTAMLCLQAVGSLTVSANMTAEAAANRAVFAKSIRSSMRTEAKKKKATSKVVMANVKNFTYVYKGAGTRTGIAGYLYKNTAAYYIKSSGSYYKVTSGKVTGYVKKSSTVMGTKAKTLAKKNNVRVATAKQSVEIYAGNGKTVVATAAKGQKYVVLKASKNWVKVKTTRATIGYIRRSKVTLENGLYKAMSTAEEKAVQDLLQGKDPYADYSDDVIKETTDETKPDETKTETETSDQETTDQETIPDDGNWKALGEFKLTAYCPGRCCNGSYAGQTATGVTPTSKHTIAVDKTVIPLGSKIRIEGDDTIYVAEDTGVKGKHIDVFFDTHAETGVFGVKYRNVYILQ